MPDSATATIILPEFLLMAIGTWTYYTASPSSPLYTDTWFTHYSYSHPTPFVAIPSYWYHALFDPVIPGELLLLIFPDIDSYLFAQALDSGGFGYGQCVLQEDGTCIEIVVDIPLRWRPKEAMSGPVVIYRTGMVTH